ncbi:glycylpeptide N-tetradecanoyltransferase 1b isoform X2 [Girardinichthys multiradiatus]|uniref:glycylpeptide N-tetradecanoyltransferase 1b isoform X2 n=1 Tax=Girardinichthys multiradiatus TaxID=208333 RepID=UPI001FAD9843|nr:glycylpeptide N-tetradecanoyltransferase 1b isoform X2 [Girardinichthys multiradiatus]
MTDSEYLDKTLTDGASGGLKKSKKKQKRENAWRPEGPRDPFAMVSIWTLCQRRNSRRYRKPFISSLWATACLRPCNRPKNTPTASGTHSLSPNWLRELCHLLNENYMEEDDNTIRFDFSPEYLLWALQPPDWRIRWHLGVRVDTNKKLVGFIAAVPAEVRIYETKKRLVQIKFLCVHKKLRLKRMTPVLIRELTRRVNQQGLHQAVYTAGTVLPTPISSCSQWHRPLNPRKLMEVNYPGLKQNMNLQRALKFNRLPEVSGCCHLETRYVTATEGKEMLDWKDILRTLIEALKFSLKYFFYKVTKINGLRPMSKEDASGIQSLLEKNLCKFHLSPLLSLQEVEHWFLPKENVNDTYVVEADDGTLTDMVSFYTVSSRVLNHPVHTGLRAACLLCIVGNPTGVAELMQDTLVLAKSKGFDVFCTLNVMDSIGFLDNLKFTISDKSVHYYLYNWKCPLISPDKVGLVLPN